MALHVPPQLPAPLPNLAQGSERVSLAQGTAAQGMGKLPLGQHGPAQDQELGLILESSKVAISGMLGTGGLWREDRAPVNAPG